MNYTTDKIKEKIEAREYRRNEAVFLAKRIHKANKSPGFEWESAIKGYRLKFEKEEKRAIKEVRQLYPFHPDDPIQWIELIIYFAGLPYRKGEKNDWKTQAVLFEHLCKYPPKQKADIKHLPPELAIRKISLLGFANYPFWTLYNFKENKMNINNSHYIIFVFKENCKEPEVQEVIRVYGNDVFNKIADLEENENLFSVYELGKCLMDKS